MSQLTLMEQETIEAPESVMKQLKANEKVINLLAERIQKIKPKFALTIGRGSSDHACTYAKYLLETNLGLVTASAAPSVVTIYNANLKLKDVLVIGISQSGKSPDICKMMEVARSMGAITVAIVNEIDSPLAKIAEFLVPLHAGKEISIAATKSYIASLSALVHLVSIAAENQKLFSALQNLPKALAEVLKYSWDEAISEFKNVNRTLVIARGFGFPIAQEAALKFKETCSIQAESFSAAEVLHGPFALIKKNHPYLLFAQDDASLFGTLELAKKIQSLGGKSILALPLNNNISQSELHDYATIILKMPHSLHPILDPIMIIEAFYLMIAKLAVARGFDPDSPENLQKITETF